MTTTHPNKSWREIYEAQRKVTPEKRTVNYTPRLGLVDVAIASFQGKGRNIWVGCESLYCSRTVKFTPEQLVEK
ncbi:MAG: hypothetical protein ACRBBQ_09280 [Cognatishimia sp.]